MSSKFYAVVIGAGPGTGKVSQYCHVAQALTIPLGRASAIRFSKAYPVALLSRSPQSYEATVKEINNAGGRAIGVNADASSIASLNAAFDTIEKEFAGHKLAAAVFNPSAGFTPKPFTEIKPEELEASIDGNMYALDIIT